MTGHCMGEEGTLILRIGKQTYQKRVTELMGRIDGQNSFIIVCVVFSSLKNTYSCPVFIHLFSKHHFQLVLIAACVTCWSLSCVRLFETPWTARFLCPWNSPCKNTGVGIHSSIQGIFLIRGSNLISCSADRLFTVQIIREVPLQPMGHLSQVLFSADEKKLVWKISLTSTEVALFLCAELGFQSRFSNKYLKPYFPH